MSSTSIHIQKPLRPVPGDTIGIIAPSSPFDREKFRTGITRIRELGFSVVFPDSIYQANGYLAGPDHLRVQNLHDMFADPNVRGIFCARGGYGALRILSSIDYALIADNPKLFVGCSDVTTLLNTFFARCNMVCLHGPMMESLALASDRTLQFLSTILLTDQDVILTPEHRIVIRGGRATGTVAGGNLTTLCHMVGTPFEPDFSGKIILLEDVGESPYRVDRMLTHLSLAGCFDDIRGIILGSFTGCGDEETIYRIFEDVFADFEIPILGGFAIGHDEPNLAIPFGISALLDTAAGLLKFEERPFS